jgi:hypothetical protein
MNKIYQVRISNFSLLRNMKELYVTTFTFQLIVVITVLLLLLLPRIMLSDWLLIPWMAEGREG